MNLNVRDLSHDDIGLIADYWTQSTPDHLRGMGADPDQLPPREEFVRMLTHQLSLPIKERSAYALIWLVDGHPVGHCNVNQIQVGKRANMHLHLWNSPNRKKGMGTRLVQLSIPHFFEALDLKELYCEPFAENLAPNKTLPKAGFEFVKSYRTIPGSINFEQEVNQWRLTRDMLTG